MILITKNNKVIQAFDMEKIIPPKIAKKLLYDNEFVYKEDEILPIIKKYLSCVKYRKFRQGDNIDKVLLYFDGAFGDIFYLMKKREYKFEDKE